MAPKREMAIKAWLIPATFPPLCTAARRRHSALYHLLLQLANLFLRYTLLHKVESLCQHTNKEFNSKTWAIKTIAIIQKCQMKCKISWLSITGFWKTNALYCNLNHVKVQKNWKKCQIKNKKITLCGRKRCNPFLFLSYYPTYMYVCIKSELLAPTYTYSGSN